MNQDDVENLVQTIRAGLFFDSESQKVAFWLTTKNPHLGNARPIDFFLNQRGHKVLRFVEGRILEDEE